MAKQVKVLRVIGKREGFRRAGLEFGAVPKNIPLEALSADAREAIQSDPMLVAYPVDMMMDDAGNLSELVGGASGYTQAELEKAAAALQDGRDRLAARWSELGAREADLDAREADLQAREQALAAAAAKKPDSDASTSTSKPKASSK
ncbi:hypothetical protein [Ralstonia solanacearum]|uniref:hypothetical protein n=1 Tax=Ralstonia solanacearum TaxID=305 RepID=UPI00168AA79E|nr:hypothetical protein [Ralstonia solanacearum]QNT25364.1 hypothetical protein C2I38_25220 [Ralstonia solanacearum]QNT63011.1 hypothetical protein C2L97_25265 [Ralstonia solanacearum]